MFSYRQSGICPPPFTVQIVVCNNTDDYVEFFVCVIFPVVWLNLVLALNQLSKCNVDSYQKLLLLLFFFSHMPQICFDDNRKTNKQKNTLIHPKQPKLLDTGTSCWCVPVMICWWWILIDLCLSALPVKKKKKKKKKVILYFFCIIWFPQKIHQHNSCPVAWICMKQRNIQVFSQRILNTFSSR